MGATWGGLWVGWFRTLGHAQMGATWNWKRNWRHLLLIAAFSRPLGKIVEIRSTCLGLDQFQMNENVTRLVIFTLEGGVTKGGYNWGGVYMEASKVLPLYGV